MFQNGSRARSGRVVGNLETDPRRSCPLAQASSGCAILLVGGGPAMIQISYARVASACFCLLAVLLLYAPLGAAVWTTQGMLCCAGDLCPIHHHQKTPAAPAHHNCGHEMGMTACSMSCCQTTDRPMVASLSFILPQLKFSFAAVLISPLETARSSIAPSRSSEPLSPPPRLCVSVL